MEIRVSAGPAPRRRPNRGRLGRHRPGPQPSPATIATLAEVGIDASGRRPTAVTADRVAAADVVVAMKPGLNLPHVEGMRYETCNLPDPTGWDVEGIRPLRDEIDRRVQALLAELAADPGGESVSRTPAGPAARPAPSDSPGGLS